MAERSARQTEVTRLLKEWRAGSQTALELLFPLVYDELRRMARSRLMKEPRGRTLQATELVHEAFLRLVDQKAGWQNRLHFYGIAARCMRRVLVDRARRSRAAKRPPAADATDLSHLSAGSNNNIEALMVLNEALDQLETDAPRQVQVAEMKVFGGLEISEIAEALSVSEATVKRDWAEMKQRLIAMVTG